MSSPLFVALLVDIICIALIAFVVLFVAAIVKKLSDVGDVFGSDKRVIMLEGNIGAGKTTFVRSLAAASSSSSTLHVVEETIGRRFLETFYRRPRDYGFALQMTQHAHRRAALLHCSQERQNVFDRSVLGDYAFALWNYAIGNLTPHQWRLYEEQAGSTIADVLQPLDASSSIIVFLADAADACSERQKKRDTKQIEKSYMLGLEATHLIVMACVPTNFSVCELQWDEYSSLSSTPLLLPRDNVLRERRATLKTRAASAIDLLVYNGNARTILTREFARLSDV